MEKHILTKGADKELLKQLSEGFTGEFKLYMIPNIYTLDETVYKEFWHKALKKHLNRTILIRLKDGELIEAYLTNVDKKTGTIDIILSNPKTRDEDIMKSISMGIVHNVRVWNTSSGIQ